MSSTNMKFTVCLMFLTAGFTSGQYVQGVPAHSCSLQGPPGIPGRDGRDCPCGTKDTQISELQNKYQVLTQQNDVLEQRLSALEGRIRNTTESDSGDEEIRELQSKYLVLEQKVSALENNTETTPVPCSGDTCILPTSCTEVVERSGFNNRAFYVIDPDGPERGVLPMVVQCDFQGDTITTLIGHNSEARTQVNGFDGRATYSKDVTYWNSMHQVRAVVDQSTLCKQHIKYECHGSVIFFSSTSPYAWWVTWDGRQADYWGGASPGSGKCACGQAGTCSGRCNCDANDLTWREDSGFLSHKDDLPVTQLRFGDASDPEEGYYTLGKLICYP